MAFSAAIVLVNEVVGHKAQSGGNEHNGEHSRRGLSFHGGQFEEAQTLLPKPRDQAEHQIHCHPD